MDRAHRQELKHDKFVEQVGHTVEYAAEHRQALIRWSAVGAAVLVIVLGYLWYSRHQAGVRQEALRTAIRTQEATVGGAQNEYLLYFATEAEKQKAVDKVWNDLANNYSGSSEAMIAHYYMAVNAADRGNIQEAEKHFKIVADDAKAEYSSQAKLALAQIYGSTGRVSDAEKILKTVIDNPTVTVSKEQATIVLARILAKTRPADARKLLEPLRGERGPVSRAAITALNDIPAR